VLLPGTRHDAGESMMPENIVMKSALECLRMLAFLIGLSVVLASALPLLSR
jgi:hypothetical protein